MKERYLRQKAFYAIGEKGQKRIREARVAIVGLGSLGTVIGDILARAGVGYLRLIDRDAVVISNLQRQTLYSEEDARQNLFKARAAAEHLRKINSEITLEPFVTDINAQNCENLLEGLDLVIATMNNDDTRLCINSTCHKRRIPWIHGTVQGSWGLTMNILPGQTACYRCLLDQEEQLLINQEEQGILNMIVGVIGSIQATEAIKILLKDQSVRKTVMLINVWRNSFQEITVLPKQECPICAKNAKKTVE